MPQLAMMTLPANPNATATPTNMTATPTTKGVELIFPAFTSLYYDPVISSEDSLSNCSDCDKEDTSSTLALGSNISVAPSMCVWTVFHKALRIGQVPPHRRLHQPRLRRRQPRLRRHRRLHLPQTALRPRFPWTKTSAQSKLGPRRARPSRPHSPLTWPSCWAILTSRESRLPPSRLAALS